MDHGPVLLGGNLGTRKDHRMERHIVFAHKLVQLHIFWVLPPLFPFVGIVGSDARVTNRSIKPDVEHLVLVTLQRHRCTPFQVTRNAARLETFLQPRLGNVDTIA